MITLLSLILTVILGIGFAKFLKKVDDRLNR